MRLYMHKVTGAVDTETGWTSSYTTEELAIRGLTAAVAFADDVSVTLLDVEYRVVNQAYPTSRLLDFDGEEWVEDIDIDGMAYTITYIFRADDVDLSALPEFYPWDEDFVATIKGGDDEL